MVKIKLRNPSAPPSNGGGTKIKVKLSRPPTGLSEVKSEGSNSDFGGSKPKIKLNLAQTTKKTKAARIRVKPTRVPGDGYDSEAPEVEDDPLMESGIIIRFLNDTNLDYVHSIVESGNFDHFRIKWRDGKKAVVNVGGAFYSARLVDLPTITEMFKTIDKKNILKTIDVCQMLLVIKRLRTSQESEMTEEDFMIPKEYLNIDDQFKDGLTPPLHSFRNRVRPKKVNRRIIEAIESKVDELIKMDEDAEESIYEFIEMEDTSVASTNFSTPVNYSSVAMDNDGDDNEQEDEDIDMVDATSGLHDEEEIEVEVEGDDLDDMNASDLEMELAEALQGNEDNMRTDRERQTQNDQSSSDEDDEDEGENDDDDDDEDDATKSSKQHHEILKEEIADLEKSIASKSKDAEKAANPLLKNRFLGVIDKLQQELDLKMRQLHKSDNNARIDDGDDENDDQEDEEDEDVGDEENDEEEDDGDVDEDIEDLF